MGGLLAWLSVCLAGRVSAEDWPRFRGPTGQGISTERNLPLRWLSGRNIAWRTPIPGEAWSSPIVAGDLVFHSESGETVVVAAGPEFEILARNPLDERCQASMAVSQGRLLIRTDKNLYCVQQPAP